MLKYLKNIKILLNYDCYPFKFHTVSIIQYTPHSLHNKMWITSSIISMFYLYIVHSQQREIKIESNIVHAV